MNTLRSVGLALVAATACAADGAWAALDPHSAELVYAAPTETGGAGMFGHVLLRLRGAGGDVAVGYAADLGDDGMLALAWKGLTGGYQAGYQIDPWQQELRGYQRGERRPVWTYPLLLDQADLDRLLGVIAERQGQLTPYNLLGGNCAAGIADLLDLAHPGAGIRASAGACVSPAEVLRAANDAHLIGPGQRLPGPGSDDLDPLDDTPAGRLAIEAGDDGARRFIGVVLRPAWHALDDPRGNIAPGDALTVLEASVRAEEGTDRPVVERLTAIDATAFAQRPRARPGAAWRLGFGSQRERLGAHGVTSQHLSASAGYGLGWTPTASTTCWLIGLVDGRLVDDASTTAGGTGVNAGLVASQGSWHLRIEGRWVWWDGLSEHQEKRTTADLAYRCAGRLAIGLTGTLADTWGWHGIGTSLRIVTYY